MKRAAVIFILPLLLASCRTLTPPDSGEVARIKVAYETARPKAFEARQSLVFEFSPHWWWPTIRMTTLGYADVDPATGNYAVVCLSPMGVKLFDVVRTNGQTNARIAMPLSGNQEEAGKAIGEDISRLYFDLTPPTDAKVDRRGDHLVFTSRHDKDWSEYEYDILTTHLVRKETCHDGLRSTLTFEDYRRYPCGYCPFQMKLINYKYRYVLTIRNLDICPAR